MKKLILLLLCMLSSQAVFAWSATYLGGSNWAISCANGTSFSYNGSSAGLDYVGPALCPGGINVEDLPSAIAQENAISNMATGYPPHGYPCLGCEPCPENPEEFCSTVENVLSGPGGVVWSLNKYNARDQSIINERYRIR